MPDGPRNQLVPARGTRRRAAGGGRRDRGDSGQPAVRQGLLTRAPRRCRPSARRPSRSATRSAGPAGGAPVVLLHGFPDDAAPTTGRAAARRRAAAACSCPICAATARRASSTARRRALAQQAALGQDLLDFLDALGIERAALAGYDWGGRAACIAAILAPERVRAPGDHRRLQRAEHAGPAAPGRGRAGARATGTSGTSTPSAGAPGLEQNRRDICRLLWREWSPTWRFDDATFERTAPSFDNPDFVAVVIHSYRHRHGNAPGDPRFDAGRAPARRAAADRRADHDPARGATTAWISRGAARSTWRCSRPAPSGAWCRTPATSSPASSPAR